MTCDPLASILTTLSCLLSPIFSFCTHASSLQSQGRNGLGNIYVWASGDGGEDDDCNCDGYAASMWTVSINSAINDGQNAHYDESCSSTLASTFSNGAKDPNTGVVSSFNKSVFVFCMIMMKKMELMNFHHYRVLSS